MALQSLPGLGLTHKKLLSIHLYSQLFSSILMSPAVVVHPSEPHPPIWFLVFPLVLWYGSIGLEPFLESFLLPSLLYDPPILVF